MSDNDIISRLKLHVQAASKIKAPGGTTGAPASGLTPPVAEIPRYKNGIAKDPETRLFEELGGDEEYIQDQLQTGGGDWYAANRSRLDRWMQLRDDRLRKEREREAVQPGAQAAYVANKEVNERIERNEAIRRQVAELESRLLPEESETK